MGISFFRFLGNKVTYHNRYGNLSAGPGNRSSEVYSFDKMTLFKGQVLRIYFYENDDQRNVVLDIDWQNLNAAQKGK